MSLSCQNLLLAAGLTFAVAAHGQSSIDELAGKFVTYVRADRKEKLVVVTDKPFYAAGESIWLKAWCLDSLSNRFIYLSKTMIVDLVDDEDSVISQLLFNIPARKTAGKMVLPPTLAEGYYWLRAYTTRIVEQDNNRIFVKPIYVVNPNKPNPDILKTYANKSAAGAGFSGYFGAENDILSRRGGDYFGNNSYGRLPQRLGERAAGRGKRLCYGSLA